jgi:choline kinase
MITIDEANDKTILEANIENIKYCKCVNYLDIVVGYRHKMIERCLKNVTLAPLKIGLKYNEKFRESVIFSVKKGFETLKSENVLLLNGDTYFSKEIFMRACEVSSKKQNGITLFGTLTENYYEDDILINVIRGRVHNIGKHIIKYNGVSSGAILISGTELNTYKEILRKERGSTHHRVLNELINQGGKVNFYNTRKKKWLEVDNEEDLARAKCDFLSWPK